MTKVESESPPLTSVYCAKNLNPTRVSRNTFLPSTALRVITSSQRFYRWLGKQLRGFEVAAPKQLFRVFVETSGVVEIEQERIVIHI